MPSQSFTDQIEKVIIRYRKSSSPITFKDIKSDKFQTKHKESRMKNKHIFRNLEVELCRREMKALRLIEKTCTQSFIFFSLWPSILYDSLWWTKESKPFYYVYHGGLYVTYGFITDTNVILIYKEAIERESAKPRDRGTWRIKHVLCSPLFFLGVFRVFSYQLFLYSIYDFQFH